MRVGVPKETMPGERRVALVPEVAARLTKAGYEVSIEAGAGERAGFSDTAYREAGASIVTASAIYGGARALLRVQRPSLDEADRLERGVLLIALLAPYASGELLERLAERSVSAFAMELVPRITRAQRMDALSSQATVAGYKAVLLAANLSPRFFPMLTTAAGTIAPAKVLVIGAGVAGLQAIATARRLGAIVEGFDIRPAAKEQVESLGAKWVGMELEGVQTAGGYAKEVSDEDKQREHELLARLVAAADVVITTAQVPGRRAPLLITADMLDAMKPGSVIVDLAAEAGGNCDGTQAGSEIERNGVLIAGPVNLPAKLPLHASQMYARNVAALLTHLAPDTEPKIDLDDDITAACCVVHEGAVRTTE